MARIETWFDQDLKKPVKVRYIDGNVFSQDNNGNVIGVNVYDKGKAAVLAGTVAASIIRADGVTVAATGTISGNKVSVVLPQAAYAVPGVLSIVLKVTSGSDVTTVCAVVGNVYMSSTDSIVDPGTIIPSIDTLIAEINAVVASIPADYSSLWTSFAPVFSANNSYVSGQYVTYNGGLYRFKNPHSGSWVTNDVVAVSIGDDLYSVTEGTLNLWQNPDASGNGVTLTQNKDGSLHIEGTPTVALFLDKYYASPLVSGSYTLSCRVTGTMTGDKRVMACVRNQSNTGTQFIDLSGGADYGELNLTAFAPYRCEVVLLTGTTYDCDLYIQLQNGKTSSPYTPPFTAIDYTARNIINEIIGQDESENVLLADARNYVDILEINEKSDITKWGQGSGVIEHNGNAVHYSLADSANGGFFTEYFSSDSFVMQITRLSFDLSVSVGSVRVWLYGTTKSGGDYANVIAYPVAGENTVSIDFAYYDVYSTLDISKPIRFLIANGGAEASNFTVTGLVFKSLVTSQTYIKEYSDGKLYSLLDNIVSAIPQLPEQTYIKSPDGNKWLLRVSNTGELSATKITPHKSAFIGNSLLMGWSTFGMSASDNEHDYYYHVTSRIHSLDSSATYSRMSNGNLEHSTNSTDFNNAFNSIKPYLTSDLDLICIQLGDNVNTNAKVTQFEKTGGSFETMVDWIHENCPNTRLIWVGTWYPSIHDWLVTACAAKGVEFVDILPFSTPENKAVLGDVVHRTEDREQTLTGSYTVSGNSLNITVTIYNVQYNITIPSYTSVVNNGDGTFTMVAPYTVIDSTGVQSHPGDSGMTAIANAILGQIGID